MSILHDNHFQEYIQGVYYKKFAIWNLRFGTYRDHAIIGVLGGFLGIIYIPYILYGGFLGDDWDVWGASYFDQTFWRMLTHRISWFAPQRPLQAYLLTMTGFAFGGNPNGYIIVNLCLWIGSIACLAFVLKSYRGKIEALLFICIASIPVISSTTLFSPAATIVVSASMFFWSLSLLTLHHYLETHETRYYILTYLLIIIGFLIYEVFLPLLIITVSVPICRTIEKKPLSFTVIRRPVFIFIMPVIAILIGITMLHKCVGVKGATQIVRPHSPSHVIHICVLWFRAITSDMRNLLINSLFAIEASFSSLSQLLAVMILLLVFFLFIKNLIPKNARSQTRLFFLVIACLSLLSCPLLFILSGYSPEIFGYGNRLMSSTWILLSIVLSWIGGKLIQTKCRGIVYFFLCLCACSMMIQRDHSIQSWELQQKIAQDCAKKILTSQVKEQAVIIGNVPKYLRNNLNNEEVFATIWDFGYAVQIYTNGLIRRGIPITATGIRNGGFIVKDEFFLVQGVYKPRYSIENLWYYEYNQATERSELIRIKDRHHLYSVLYTAEKYGINEEPMRANKGIRTLLSKM